MTYAIDYSGDNVDDPDRPYLINRPTDLGPHLERLGFIHSYAGGKLLAQLGPAGRPPELVLGISDVGDDAGRAVLQWLPTREFAFSADNEEPTTPVVFDGLYIDAVGDLIEFPPEATQITPQLVRAAVEQYITTGQRPRSVDWRQAPPVTRYG